MELRQYLTVVQRWWWALLLGALIAGGTSYVLGGRQPPIYVSSTTLLVNVSSTPGTTSPGDAALSERLVKTYTHMIVQPVVLEQAISRLRLPLSVGQLRSMVTVQPVRDTQLFTIQVQGPDPEQVRDVANAVAAVFIEQQNQRLALSLAANAISVVQPALLPTSPVPSRRGTDALLAALVGLLVMLGLVLVLEYLDDTIKSPSALEQAAALPALASVMRFRRRPHERGVPALVSFEGEHVPEAEVYRLLRTNLDFTRLETPWQMLLVTSAGPGEGKSTTVANLALALAQAGRRVVAVDADLRKPALHRIFAVDNQRGLTNLLLTWGSGNDLLERYLAQGPAENLWVLSSGPPPPNPAELLQGQQFAEILAALRRYAEFIIVDSPPVLAVADALLLAQRTDATILVVDAGRTRAESARQAVAALRQSGTRLLGAVLNKQSRRTADQSHYYYYYYSSEQGGNGRNGAKGKTRAKRTS